MWRGDKMTGKKIKKRRWKIGGGEVTDDDKEVAEGEWKDGKG